MADVVVSAFNPAHVVLVRRSVASGVSIVKCTDGEEYRVPDYVARAIEDDIRAVYVPAGDGWFVVEPVRGHGGDVVGCGLEPVVAWRVHGMWSDPVTIESVDRDLPLLRPDGSVGSPDATWPSLAAWKAENLTVKEPSDG